MKFSVALLILLVYSSGILAGDRKQRIVGGHESKPHSHPYLASLQMNILWTRIRICSGSLLSHRWILTAAHCVKGNWLMNWLTMEAIVGSHNVEWLDPQAQRVKISKRIPHPSYSGGIGPHDIAMLKTEKDVKYTHAVYPIELPNFSHDRLNYENLMIAGWGALRTTIFIPDLPDTLQEVDVQFLPYKKCKKAIDVLNEEYETNPLNKKSNICTGPLTGGVAGCSGDSGGPLIQYIKNTIEEFGTTTVKTMESGLSNDIETKEMENQIDNTPTFKDEGSLEGILEDLYKAEEKVPIVIGVVSWGVTPCGEVGAPTIYTNVSAYMDFINKYLES